MLRILFTMFFILGLIGCFAFAFIQINKQKKSKQEEQSITERKTSSEIFFKNIQFLKAGTIYVIICTIIIIICGLNLTTYLQLDKTTQGDVVSVINNTTIGKTVATIHYTANGRVSVLEAEVTKDIQPNTKIAVKYNSNNITSSMVDGSYGLCQFWLPYLIFSVIYLIVFLLFLLTTTRDITDFKKRYGN